MARWPSVPMNDAYEGVRLVARRSLRALPGFAGFDYPFAGTPKERGAGVMKVMEVWRRSQSLAEARHAPALLLDVDGAMKGDVMRLLRQRDHRRIDLRE